MWQSLYFDFVANENAGGNGGISIGGGNGGISIGGNTGGGDGGISIGGNGGISIGGGSNGGIHIGIGGLGITIGGGITATVESKISDGISKVINMIEDLRQSLLQKNIPQFITSIQHIFPVMQSLNTLITVGSGKDKITTIYQLFTKLVVVAKGGDEAGSNLLLNQIEDLLREAGQGTTI